MLVISKETIKELYSMEECIQDVEKAFSYGQRNKTLTPVRMSIPHSKYEAETLYMPSYIELFVLQMTISDWAAASSATA